MVFALFVFTSLVIVTICIIVSIRLKLKDVFRFTQKDSVISAIYIRSAFRKIKLIYKIKV